MLYQLSYSRNETATAWVENYNQIPGLPPEPPVGIEPTTARLRIECSTTELRWRDWKRSAISYRLSVNRFTNGVCFSHGAEGDRTPDLCSAIAALSQLSYSPNNREPGFSSSVSR